MDESLENGTVDFILVPDDRGKRSALLQIFNSDEERYGSDVLGMNDLCGNCIAALNKQLDLNCNDTIPVRDDIPGLLGMLTGFLKGVMDASGDYQLLGDLDSLDAGIKRKLKTGVYHIAESKKIDGNMRAAIVDADNEIKAQITLKKVPNTAANLASVAALTMQEQ